MLDSPVSGRSEGMYIKYSTKHCWCQSVPDKENANTVMTGFAPPYGVWFRDVEMISYSRWGI